MELIDLSSRITSDPDLISHLGGVNVKFTSETVQGNPIGFAGAIANTFGYDHTPPSSSHPCEDERGSRFRARVCKLVADRKQSPSVAREKNGNCRSHFASSNYW